ncbi:MAG TPA: alpha/beta fold hydrolase, partial [Candidatus Eisenbacteria bacterium]|nr:alpha/beta fold hydrolase [Candidatus Eisenbacteria bacterium]
VLRRFPLTPGGKVDRQKLPPPPTPAEMQKNFVPPRTETEAKLVEIWERMLGIKPIGIRDNFFEIGGHSLLEARFVAEVEKSFGITLPVTTLYYTRTIEALVKIIEDNKTSPRNSLWHRCHTQGTKPPLFAYGGSTDLADCLGPDQPLYWSEFHGTDGLPMPDTIEEMAAEYISQMRSIQPHGPYFLLGYSMGGLVIFEAAQQLAAIGEPVGLLVLVDPAPPANMVRIGKTDGGVDSRRFRLKDLGYRVRRRIAWSKRVLGQSFCEACLRHGYRLPPGLRLFYFDYKSQAVLSRYHARTYRGPFILFRRPDNRTAEQWRSLASEDIELHESWVEHYEFLEQPYVQTVAGILRQRLAQARGKSLEGRARAEAQSAWHGDAHPST